MKGGEVGRMGWAEGVMQHSMVGGCKRVRVGGAERPGGHCQTGHHGPLGLSGFYPRATVSRMQNQLCASERSLSRAARKKGQAGDRDWKRTFPTSL